MARQLKFIASYPRSGNTWARLFLLYLLRGKGLIPPGADDRDDIGEHLPWDTSPRYAHRFLTKDSVDLTPVEISGLRAPLHRWLSNNVKLQPYVKTHAFYGVLHGHPTFDPTVFGGAVYVIRNPLDVAPSLARHYAISVEMAIIGMGTPLYVARAHKHGLPEPWGSWSINARSWIDLKGGKVLVTRYEDLLANPEAEFARMLPQLGLSATVDEIRTAVEATSLDRLEKLESDGKFRNPSKRSERFFGVGARVAYQEKLTPAQARSLILSHRAVMDRFGYLDAAALEFAALSRDEALGKNRI